MIEMWQTSEERVQQKPCPAPDRLLLTVNPSSRSMEEMQRKRKNWDQEII